MNSIKTRAQAESRVGRSQANRRDHIDDASQARDYISICRLTTKLNPNEPREFRMLPKSTWPVFLHGRAVHPAIGASELAEISPGQALKRTVKPRR
jgi:hypothetical protein